MFLDTLGAADPKLVAERSLLRRVDSTFSLLSTEVLDFLDCLEGNYRVIRGASPSCFVPYASHYFDTPDEVLYRSHVDGDYPSMKVRIRKYPERSLSYLEFKIRVSQLRNHKTRFVRALDADELDEVDRRRVQKITGLDHATLSVNCIVSYRRMTLVSIHHSERVTIDTAMSVQYGDVTLPFGPECIVEVKQARESMETPIMQRLGEREHSRISFSKYCSALEKTRNAEEWLACS